MYQRRSRAHSARTRGRCLVPPLCGLCAAAAFLGAVLLLGVVEGPPPVPRRGGQLAGALVLPEPGPPALPVPLVPLLPLALQVARAGRLGDAGQGGGPAPPAAGTSLGQAVPG